MPRKRQQHQNGWDLVVAVPTTLVSLGHDRKIGRPGTVLFQNNYCAVSVRSSKSNTLSSFPHNIVVVHHDAVVHRKHGGGWWIIPHMLSVASSSRTHGGHTS